MEISFDHQGSVLLISMLFGVIVGVIYDAFYLLGMICGVKNSSAKLCEKFNNSPTIEHINKGKIIFDFIFDLLFFITITPLSCILLFVLNKGIVRWYIVTSAIIGFGVYKSTLSKIIIWFNSYVLLFLKSMILKFVSFLKKHFSKVKNRKVGQKMPH